LRAQQACPVEMVIWRKVDTEARAPPPAAWAGRTVKRFDSEPNYLFTLGSVLPAGRLRLEPATPSLGREAG